ncbi:MAG: hypothetical protein DWQ36_19310 [Acidobacteria bacterium]|nr:MAG: hypothetical protein DWQ30_06330 [Acidobacteriota bacterium]REK03692.1 MAG: hypothetical protein DWQ36_19310 [Acidobacteriota bacterium]
MVVVALVAPIALVALTLAMSACAGDRRAASPDAPLETQEIGAGPTDALGAEGDVREEGRARGPAGAIPADFPSDLPLPTSSSVAGFGVLSESRRYLDLESTLDPAALDDWLRQRWSAWRREGARSWTRPGDGQQVRVEIDAAPPGSRLRIDYPARVLPAR